MATKIDDIHQDPVITRLLEKMPKKVASSFNEEQLSHLRNAIGAREWGKHKLDVRGTVKFLKWRYYYVILAGRNRRSLSEKEVKVARVLTASIVATFITFAVLLGLIVIYLIKSALGINLIDGWSLGLWTWFKELL
ncbi:3-phosphoshikimate 1-carboxyvinyltransferase [Alteromonas sp. V450]|uniref:3-phosphoshikimate 1-carboxyvinyltransferase n=1 Tax=Alteromonas sp. V450 TaxID=1912139 RepID=UPI0008FF6C0B|nr:3-phosphoshikimate 1-carboxyvinyltransferase [Alteromonas sp. V450]OJF67702.1 3-phosphoshikimate 1-carboxyvinyltransferase [Alteromonas sp. V450]